MREQDVQTNKQPARRVSRVRSRNSLAVALAALLVAPFSAWSAGVTCTLLVGGQASATMSYQFDSKDSGREHLFLEANQYQADAMIQAVDGQVEVGMEIYSETAEPAASFYNYARLAGTVPGPATQTVSIVNGTLRCEIF